MCVVNGLMSSMWVERSIGDGEWDLCSLGRMEAAEMYTVGKGGSQRGEI